MRIASSTKDARADCGLLTTADVAEYLNCTSRMVHGIVRRGQLHPLRIGGAFVFTRTDLDRFEKRVVKRFRKPQP